MNELERAAAGEELPVDAASIEQTLAELWRVETTDETAVTRAALWNVVAHARTPQDHSRASEILGRAANAVPQRTIVVRADPSGVPELASWISANCHMLGEGKQVCSEEIAIAAGGRHVERVAPLVSALLIPDMPVAVWIVGDLPHEEGSWIASLLEPADRLIVDSSCFGHPDDIDLVADIATATGTAPADLNWLRGEEWRSAVASIFDPPNMRSAARGIRQIRIAAGRGAARFGASMAPLLMAAWLMARAGIDAAALEPVIELRDGEEGLLAVELELEEGRASVTLDRERGVLVISAGGGAARQSVLRTGQRRPDELIVRELKQPKSDPLLLDVLPRAALLARRAAR